MNSLEYLSKQYIKEVEVKKAAIELLEELKIMIKEYKHVDLISEVDDIIEMLEEVNYGE